MGLQLETQDPWVIPAQWSCSLQQHRNTNNQKSLDQPIAQVQVDLKLLVKPVCSCQSFLHIMFESLKVDRSSEKVCSILDHRPEN